MSAHLVPAGRGARWLGEGFVLFRRSPLGWLALVVLYFLCLSVAGLVPFLGAAIVPMLIPAFSVGFMAAARSCERGESLQVMQLFDGFRVNLTAQLSLGGLYFVAIVLLLGLTALTDGGALARWMLVGEKPDEAMLESADFSRALMLAFALYVPVSAAFWFAPLLVAWRGMSSPKALFYSFFGALVNWRAFLAYGVVVGVFTLVVPTVVFGLVLLAAGGGARTGITALVFPMLLILLPVLLASFYVSWRDVFEAAASPAPDAGPG